MYFRCWKGENMVAGHLRQKDGYWHLVLSFIDENGNKKTPSRSTKLPIKNNKRKAEEMLQTWRKEMNEELQERILAKKSGREYGDNIRFTKYLMDWLKMMKPSVEPTTYCSYDLTIRRRIVPYFDENFPKILLSRAVTVALREVSRTDA